MAVTEAPVLLTERLELRLPVAADRDVMAAIVSHRQTGRFLGHGFDPVEHFMRFMRNAGSWQLYGYGAFMIRSRASGELIGNGGVFHTWRGLGEDFDDTPEAGWILRHDQVGQGLGFEAMRAVLDWFDREHGPRRIVCMTDPENEPSIGLAGKLGFTALREAVMPAGETVRLFERLPAA
jgi:RimJ/RimL family protein N-acetyltransferase